MATKPTILCVDDEKSVLSGLKEQLSRIFIGEYSIETADNGPNALEIIQELYEDKIEIPVVISDHIMPGMKGDELLKEIYSINPHVKKILLTGQADADAIGRAVNYANLYRYLSKPWEQNDLALTVKEAIHSYFQDKTLEEQNKQLIEINNQLELVNEKLNQKIILFNKFVPNQFLNLMHIDLDKQATIKAITQDYIELAQCAERELTIMFSDIRSFTSICESLTTAEAFELTNNYLNIMGPVISKHNGFIDKFIGDAIMALFTKPDDAVLAGIAMQKTLQEWNAKMEAAGKKTLAIGVGINTGSVTLGTIGDDNRLQTTVIGDPVNLTARTEKQTKNFKAPVMITANTFHKLSNPAQFNLRFIERGAVRGKKEMLDFYEVLDSLPPAVQEKKKSVDELYKKGVLLFAAGEIDQARPIFEECLKISPEDYASQYYLIRTNQQHYSHEE